VNAKRHEHWEIIRATVKNGSDKEMLYVDPISGGVVTFAPGETKEANVKVNYPPSPHSHCP
jgi:hypothetical protein